MTRPTLSAHLRSNSPRGGAVTNGWMRRARPVAGAAILGTVAWRFGAHPFLTGLRAVIAPALIAASGLTFVATICSAWRWRIVAAQLGPHMRLRTPTAGYYRSQFLNTVLPGGV